MHIEKLRLVQLSHPTLGRRIAMVKEPSLVLIKEMRSIYELALAAIDRHQKIRSLIESLLSEELLDYDRIYDGNSEWKILPSFDHPDDLAKCLVSGTGLTHHNSALNRQVMHQSVKEMQTDSMIMYQWGIDGGAPPADKIGIQPEWFYKGNGSILKAHGQALQNPVYANDGGEEPEVAGVYLIDRLGNPIRIGLSIGNEFSDHVMEKKNYLYLAPSKLRECAIGPELVIDADFQHYQGTVSIIREDQLFWSSPIKTGARNMCHLLTNLEHHHFKYKAHRVPLQAHVHFFGADAFSFGHQVKLKDKDIMKVEWVGLGRALKNSFEEENGKEQLVTATSIN